VLGLEVYVRREDAERFIEEVRGDDPELAKPLRIEERELEAGRAGPARPARGSLRQRWHHRFAEVVGAPGRLFDSP
jgi:hypothetical protein